MIGRVSKVRHAIVGAAIGGTTLLAAMGVIGSPSNPERFDAKMIVVEPVGEGLRITEHVDIDFGDEHRRGYERIVPNDFGVPTDVTAHSPDANDTVNLADLGGATRIRIGDPNITFTGQHRYQLAYTLPNAHFDELGLDLDIVSPPGGVYAGDQETLRFEVVVTGFELDETFCDVGGFGAEGGCVLEAQAGEPPEYRALLEPLHEDEGLSIGGAIVARTPSDPPPAPPVPERRTSSSKLPIAAGTAVLGLLGAVPVYRWARRRGSNEVYAGGAAEAAYGAMPPPGTSNGTEAPPAITLVPDDEMRDLATIEFVPPKGIEPWEASVLVTEQLGDDAVEAWISTLVAREAIEISEHDKKLTIASGPRRGDLDPVDAQLLDGILGIDDPYTTGKYDSKFASAWSAISESQRRRIEASGWWKHLPPGSGLRLKTRASPFAILTMFAFVMFWSGSALTAFFGAFQSVVLGLAIALLFPAVVAYFVYRAMLPARSAQGSALALRAESFRRFLHASEGRHVEWAWSQGLLREYSAWAVAMGEADAWSDALERANVPEPARMAALPLAVHHFGSSMHSARTAPSSSGSSGGFSSGGGVGGGGGGGSSGSW